MKHIKTALIFCLCLLSGQISNAQFYTAGDNPASVRWSEIETGNYRIIYPSGLDSLARTYGLELEKYRIPVGRTAGYLPGEMIRVKMPVVLHAFNAQSNGSVAWAPKMMNLFTVPQSPDSEAMPWKTMLAIHESRHVAQMQAGLTGCFRPFRYITGEMFNGLVAGLHSRMEMLEGDAVVAETALSMSGRGRTSDFMNYYMIAFDRGDFRNWEKWRFGSQKNYTPNYYAAGYMMIGGLRYVYGYRDVVKDVYRHIPSHPFDLDGLSTMVRRKTGLKLREAYYGIADSLNTIWQQDIAERGPFMYAEQVTATPKRYTEYAHNDFLGGWDHLYAVRGSLAQSDNLVRIGMDGREHRISAFASGTSTIRHSDRHKRIYWSELVSDPRWSMRVYSVIRYKSFPYGAKHSLTRKGRLYNPHLSPDEDYLSVTEYTDDGMSHIVILDALDGKRMASSAAPDSVQFLESVWEDGTIFATGISDHGYGIYSIGCDEDDLIFGKEWEQVLRPQPVRINSLSVMDDMLVFTSDRNGVNELYHYDPEEKELFQVTSTRYGATDFVYDENCDTLFFNAAEYEGKIIMKTPVDSLPYRKVSVDSIYRYRMADELSRQEQELAAEEGYRFCPDSVKFTEPKRYRKAAHLFNIHSWAPFYFNVDNIMDFSADYVYDMISLGAAAVSQNDLGTAISQFGYSAHKDPYDREFWRHSGHFKFTYTGWYPVIEVSVDFNDRGARNMMPYIRPLGTTAYSVSILSEDSGKAYASGNISAWIPFNFSSGGWYRTFVPKVSYSISNDMFSNGKESIPVQYLRASLRGSIYRPVAESGVYPRIGIGAEIGAGYEVGLERFISPAGYAYIYGYLPGIIKTQGLKVSALYQQRLDSRTWFTSQMTNTAPRGFSGNATLSSHIGSLPSSVLLTADYAIPIFAGDLSIGGTFMYIRRFVLTPHFDYSFFGRGTGLYSAGADFAVNFRSLFWLEFPFTVGLTYSYNGGRSYGTMQKNGIPMGRHYVGPVFSVEF